MSLLNHLEEALRVVITDQVRAAVRGLAVVFLHSPSRSMLGCCECPACKSSGWKWHQRSVALARQSRRRLRELHRRQVDDIARKARTSPDPAAGEPWFREHDIAHAEAMGRAVDDLTAVAPADHAP
jgi:hypothetical protein